jgi:hypothetical protein
MNRTALFAALLSCCLISTAVAGDADLGTKRTPEPKGYGEAAQPSIQVGGDNFGNATVIPALPYVDGGNTCAFADDYVPPCVPQNSPDVVYAFRPTKDMCVDISLCNSGYDTEIVVYANDPSTVVACQDDSPDCGLESHLTNVPLVAGTTYYILVDGYGGACGTYLLEMMECPPPPVCDPCPPGAIAENEPVCGPGYVDNFNGGCNSVPVVTSILTCEPEITVCGTYGTYDAGTRDTDWYEFTINAPTTITASVTGQGLTGTAVAIIDANCPPVLFDGDFVTDAQCAVSSVSAAVGPGTYRVFVASFFDGTPCGATYVLNLSGLTCPPVPANTTSWGKVKNIYR